jgi:peptide alpha-N-acetyltransferase
MAAADARYAEEDRQPPAPGHGAGIPAGPQAVASASSSGGERDGNGAGGGGDRTGGGGSGGAATPTKGGAAGRESDNGNGGSNGGGHAGNGKRCRHVTYRQYRGEEDLPHVMRLIDAELSEPYSIFTYRYFLHQWPSLCIFACGEDGSLVGTIVAKVEPHKCSGAVRGYIAMLVVIKSFRGAGIGTQLVRRAIDGMRAQGAQEVVLEAETHNAGALAMYEGLGFIRDKRLERYYLSGTDAFRLKLLLPAAPGTDAALDATEAEDEARRLEVREADVAALKVEALRVESCA